jgi:hypothetical protein
LPSTWNFKNPSSVGPANFASAVGSAERKSSLVTARARSSGREVNRQIFMVDRFKANVSFRRSEGHFAHEVLRFHRTRRLGSCQNDEAGKEHSWTRYSHHSLS